MRDWNTYFKNSKELGISPLSLIFCPEGGYIGVRTTTLNTSQRYVLHSFNEKRICNRVTPPLDVFLHKKRTKSNLKRSMSLPCVQSKRLKEADPAARDGALAASASTSQFVEKKFNLENALNKRVPIKTGPGNNDWTEIKTQPSETLLVKVKANSFILFR